MKYMRFSMVALSGVALAVGLSGCLPLPAKVMQDTYMRPVLTQGWQIVELAGHHVDNQRDVAIRFDGENRFTVTTGCNRLFGQYQTTKNQHLTFQAVASTRMACRNMAIEEQVRYALNHADGYRIVGNELIVTNIQGQPVLRGQAVQ